MPKYEMLGGKDAYVALFFPKSRANTRFSGVADVAATVGSHEIIWAEDCHRRRLRGSRIAGQSPGLNAAFIELSIIKK